jgi:hypothetical protein
MLYEVLVTSTAIRHARVLSFSRVGRNPAKNFFSYASNAQLNIFFSVP